MQTGKDRVNCPCEHINMASWINLKESIWSTSFVVWNKKQTEGSWTYVGRSVAGSYYQRLCSYYQITARPCHPEEEKEEQQIGEMRFFFSGFFFFFFFFFFFLWIFFFFFFLLPGFVIVHTAYYWLRNTASQFMEKFCVKAFHVDSFCISPMGTGWSTINREC